MMTIPERENLPDDPVTQYAAWAIEMHESFSALTSAGFTHEQAFRIVLAGIPRGWYDAVDDDED